MPRLRGLIMSCVECGFAANRGADRTLRHCPLPEVRNQVERWLAAHAPRDESQGDGAGVTTPTAADDAVPLPRPEVLLGRLLDENHSPRINEPFMSCVECGFGTDDSLTRALRHYPLPEEFPDVEPWLAAYGPRNES